MYDVVVVGAGIAGMSTAARLQAAGLQTLVIEAHRFPGGCAGYFRRDGFAFDVGATTLVDFEAGGIGGELMETIGMPAIDGELLPGYVAWLPDRKVILHRDSLLWAEERLRVLGDSPAHKEFWSLFDRLAATFWSVSRQGIKLPIQSIQDLYRGGKALGISNWPMVRYLGWTVGDALRAHGLRENKPLTGLLSMLIEDTVHSSLDDAPLINGALGATIRGAGLMRARGGMYGFWRQFISYYRALGGHLRVGTEVTAIRGRAGKFTIETSNGYFQAHRVVSAVPVELTARLAPAEVVKAIEPYIKRDKKNLGSAVVLFLGVPEEEVASQSFTHNQLLDDYNSPLGNGNNMFISVSSADDIVSAPPGYRAVMISTHCDLEPWENLSKEEYQHCKQLIGNRLLELARRVYPNLGCAARVQEVASPCTYERFTGRPRGAVGGVRLTLANSNQHAVPHNIGVPGFWLCGDSTWPGLGTVACVLGSRIVTNEVLNSAKVRQTQSLQLHFAKS